MTARLERRQVQEDAAPADLLGRCHPRAHPRLWPSGNYPSSSSHQLPRTIPRFFLSLAIISVL